MISVVIPAFNAASTIHECLHAIGQSECSDYEVVVVDDGSTDGSGDIAMGLDCRLVALEHNAGAAAAKNAGARAARGDILLFTDADVLLRPGTLQLAAEVLNDQSITAVVGLLGQELRYNDFPSQFKNLWMHYTYSRLADSGGAERSVGVFYTSIAAIRRDVFLSMGGFDSNYRGASVTEDIEFGQRLLTAGHKVCLDGRMQVEHIKHYSLQGLIRTDLRRAHGLAKTWLRKRLTHGLQETGQKYYASVPWFFVAGVPLAWLLPALAVAGFASRQPAWALAAFLDYVAILLVNLPFLSALQSARGWWFLLQSCIFLPVDLWVSGLGIVWAAVDYVRGRRY